MLAIEMLAGKNGMEKAEALASRMPLVHYHTSCLAWADGGAEEKWAWRRSCPANK